MAIHGFGYMDLVLLMRGKAAATHVGKHISNNLSWERPLEVIKSNPVFRSGPTSRLDEITPVKF